MGDVFRHLIIFVRREEMRAKIFIQKTGGKVLSFDYQYYLASMLYKKLAAANVKLANELHSRDDFKFYTFSNLVTEDRKNDNNGLQFKNAHFYLSSPDTEFIRSFTEGLLQLPEFELNGTRFAVNRIEILPEYKTENTSFTLKTLSPIYIKTVREIEGELKEWDLYPKDGK